MTVAHESAGSERTEGERAAEDMPVEGEYDDFGAVIANAIETEGRGDLVGALDILRSAQLPPFEIADGVRVERGQITFEVPTQILTLKAYRAQLSLILGQWSDAPRHDSSSDSPHGFLTMYESLGPRLPESNRLLRLFMDRLRVRVGLDHDRAMRAAAWAFDIYDLLRTDEDLASNFGRFSGEALGNMAVSMSQLGFKSTARSLYQQCTEELNDNASNRAAALIRYGDMLWSIDAREEAEACYLESLETLENWERHTVTTLHDQVRVRARLADCHLLAERWTEAASMTLGAFDLLDAARERGAYQLARSVDASVAADIEHLLSYLARIPVEHLDATLVVKALLIVGNSSSAARLRNGRKRPSAPTAVRTDELDDTAHAAVESAQYWHPVREADVDAVFASPNPVLFATFSRGSSRRLYGLSILAGAELAARVHTWSLHPSQDREDFELLNALLAPPPGSADQQADGVWTRPWDPEAMTLLSERLFPVDALASVVERRPHGIAVVPVGVMWRFPFATIAVGGQPLGAVAPVVLTPGPIANQPASTGSNWAGHFDLSLSAAFDDLKVALLAARTAGSDLVLFTEVAEFSQVAGLRLLMFAGHGESLRNGQRLRLASGERCQAVDFRGGLTPGAVVVLSACWSGAVADTHGSDTSEQALQFLVGGAHSVLGTNGPINDTRAGQFLARYLPEVADGETSARAALRAINALLEQEPHRPLSSWASYATLGRACDYSTDADARRNNL